MCSELEPKAFWALAQITIQGELISPENPAGLAALLGRIIYRITLHNCR